MKTEERIIKSLDIFEVNIKEIDELNLDKSQEEVKNMAKRYYEDTKYYIKQDDILTAFAAIEYAHGLLDGLRIIYNLLKDD
ncbi:MAG: DUF357 domain-containing protein [Methanobacteriaceae archaeon]|nr:DUF357 domain-containing protein [Methanobacteriaceae archaeon]